MINWKHYPEDKIDEDQLNLIRIKGTKRYFYSIVQLSVLNENPMQHSQYNLIKSEEFDFIYLQDSFLVDDITNDFCLKDVIE